MKRVHRTFGERFSYLAIYECKDCRAEEFVRRQFRMHLGETCCCPKCGTLRVRKLIERDQIDPMMSGLLNLLERLIGGSLYHCRFCRIQFYDRRKLKSRDPDDNQPMEAAAVVTPPNTASSGA